MGFLTDGVGQAALDVGETARVVVELDALGFNSVVVEVFLTWDQPQLFVSVPFNPIPRGAMGSRRRAAPRGAMLTNPRR